MGSAVIACITKAYSRQALFPPKNTWVQLVYHVSTRHMHKNIYSTTKYCSQILYNYGDGHLTCFPEAAWRQHRPLGRMAATRFASQVPVQPSDLLTDAPTL